MKKSCTICKNKGKYLFSTLNKEILYCESCSLAWTANFSEPNYKHYHRDQTSYQDDKLFENIFQKTFNLALKYKSSPGKILEIGSSTGLLLSIFKNAGWHTTGIEPSREASKISKSKGIHTVNSNFEAYKGKSNYFDLIIANHTLEHLKNPFFVLKKINHLLKDDGVSIISVPNFDSINSKLFRKKWPLLLPNEHRWYFTPQSLTLLSNKSSFRIIKSFTNSGLLGLYHPIQDLYLALVSKKKRFFTNLANLPLDLFSTLLGKGQNLTIVLKKK